MVTAIASLVSGSATLRPSPSLCSHSLLGLSLHPSQCYVIQQRALLWEQQVVGECGGFCGGLLYPSHLWVYPIMPLQWSLSIRDTLNKGHLSDEATVCSSQ